MIKIDYSKCCWNAQKSKISGVPKTDTVFEQDGKCVSDDCGCSCGCGDKCEGCVEACPVEAIVRKDKVEIDKDKCINCGACVAACPKEALSME